MKKLIFILLNFIALFSFAQSQTDSDFFKQKRFNAGLVAGFNASELAGEGLDSYIGWNIGVFGIASITKKIHLSTELLFSQNGEYLTPAFFPNLEFSQIKLNFIEIPLQINWQLQQSEAINDRKGWLRMGMAYAHLLDFKIQANGEDVTSQIIWEKENAWLVSFGGTFFLSQHFGIDVKMSLPIDAEDLIPTFAFRGVYLL